MATLNLKRIKKIYPHSGDQKKAKKKKDDTEKKVNLQVTEQGVVAVQEFNLDIADKEFIVLVGPSGCGKSTTLRMVAGLEEISEGELYIDGQLVNKVPPKDRDIAMVFQSYALFPHYNVFDNVAYGLKIRKLPKEEIRQRVMDILKLVIWEELMSRAGYTLLGVVKVLLLLRMVKMFILRN